MSAGKGDKRRPFNQQKWDENYDKIFKNNKLLNESKKQEDILKKTINQIKSS
jgi:hypothetical protein